jgi:hypothetical protein
VTPAEIIYQRRIAVLDHAARSVSTRQRNAVVGRRRLVDRARLTCSRGSVVGTAARRATVGLVCATAPRTFVQRNSALPDHLGGGGRSFAGLRECPLEAVACECQAKGEVLSEPKRSELRRWPSDGRELAPRVRSRCCAS